MGSSVSFIDNPLRSSGSIPNLGRATPSWEAAVTRHQLAERRKLAERLRAHKARGRAMQAQQSALQPEVQRMEVQRMEVRRQALPPLRPQS